MPGPYMAVGTLVDDEGRIYCDDIEDKYTYSLNSTGAILWQKHFLGYLVDVFPSGGLLAVDDSSIMRIDSDGSIAWRHYTAHGGSQILMASDETLYYSDGASVYALVPSSGLSEYVVLLLILVAVDVIAAVLYGLSRWMRKQEASGQ
jgi:hypothetical protein